MGVSLPTQNKGWSLLRHGPHGLNKGWNVKTDSDEGSDITGAKLAVCLSIFSKAVKNKWSPADGDDRRRMLIRDMNGLCVRVEENHVWVCAFNVVLQEQKILELVQYDIEVSCVCGSGACCGSRRQHN